MFALYPPPTFFATIIPDPKIVQVSQITQGKTSNLSKLIPTSFPQQEIGLGTLPAQSPQISPIPYLSQLSLRTLAQPRPQGLVMDTLQLAPLHILTREQLRSPTSVALTQQAPFRLFYLPSAARRGQSKACLRRFANKSLPPLNLSTT